jgi:phospholipid/cholesterol/gamma-HCH transport system substrate-binding protein
MMKSKREEIKAGFVVLAALVIFSVMVVLIGGSRFWEKQDVYRIRFSAIGGLEPGASVRLGGFRVGRVLAISVTPDDVSKIEVAIGVKPGTPICQGVVARVATLGLVGDYYVLLTQKPGSKEPFPPGSAIPSQEMVEMGDLLVEAARLSETLGSSVEAVVAALNRILSEENIGHFRTSLEGLSRLTVESETTLSRITAELGMVLKRLNGMIANLDAMVSENRDNIQNTVHTIKTAVEGLDDLVRTVNQTLVENRDDVRSTITTINQDTQKAGQLLDHLDGRIAATGDYLEETMANLMEISENLRLLSIQLKRQPWQLIYRGKVKR